MKKEEKKFVESLNKDKIKGHEVDSLRYNRDGTWAFVVLCSCGSLHPIGGVDDKFVLWSINVIEEKSWETFTKDDLPSLSWEYNYR